MDIGYTENEQGWWKQADIAWQDGLGRGCATREQPDLPKKSEFSVRPSLAFWQRPMYIRVKSCNRFISSNIRYRINWQTEAIFCCPMAMLCHALLWKVVDPVSPWKHCLPFDSILRQARGKTGAAQLSAPSAALWAPGKAWTKSSPACSLFSPPPPPASTTLPPFCRFQSFSFPKCRLPNVMPL